MSELCLLGKVGASVLFSLVFCLAKSAFFEMFEGMVLTGLTYNFSMFTY